jgi:hypothetical protein
MYSREWQILIASPSTEERVVAYHFARQSENEVHCCPEKRKAAMSAALFSANLAMKSILQHYPLAV